jgi:hypothetical protein
MGRRTSVRLNRPPEGAFVDCSFGMTHASAHRQRVIASRCGSGPTFDCSEDAQNLLSGTLFFRAVLPAHTLGTLARVTIAYWIGNTTSKWNGHCQFEEICHEAQDILERCCGSNCRECVSSISACGSQMWSPRRAWKAILRGRNQLILGDNQCTRSRYNELVLGRLD